MNNPSKNAWKFVICDPEKCTGCELCGYACSFKKAKVFSPFKSRIQVIRFHPLLNLTVSCLLCDDAPCVKACPADALEQSKETGVILVDEEKCTTCGWCVQACPYGAMQIDLDTKVVFVCDLCEGEPKCIEWCPEDALELGGKKTYSEKVHEFIGKNELSQSPEVKKWF